MRRRRCRTLWYAVSVCLWFADATAAHASAGATDTSFGDKGLYIHRPAGSTQSVTVWQVAWLSNGRILALGGTASGQSSLGSYTRSDSFELDYSGKLDAAATASIQTDDYSFVEVRELIDVVFQSRSARVAVVAENVGCRRPVDCSILGDPGPRFVSRQFSDGAYGIGGNAVVDSHAGNAAVLSDGSLVSLGLTYRSMSQFFNPSLNVPVTFDVVAMNAAGRRVPALEALFLAQMVRCSPTGAAVQESYKILRPALAVTPTDKILFALGPCMMRLNPDGTADMSFGTGGVSTIDNAGLQVVRLLLMPDGSMLTFHMLDDGSTYRVAKRLPNGQPDTSFGPGGIIAALPLPFALLNAGSVTSPNAHGLPALDRKGRILIAGTVGASPPPPGQAPANTSYLARFDGALKHDRSFGDPVTGLARLGDASRGLFIPRSVAIDDLDGIIVAGQLQTGAVGTFGSIFSEVVTRLLPDDDATVKVVEFYHFQRDHYFMTWNPDEIAKLTASSDWRRTPYEFRAFRNAQASTSAVCRWYLPPGYGDSHFFGRDAVECNKVAHDFPAFILEDPAYMHVQLPVNGVCPAGTVPVYRLFDNRPDANHRYTTELTVRNEMVGKGWVSEGDGPLGVAICAVG